MPHKYAKLALTISAIMMIQSVSAELYISPVMKNAVGAGMPSSVTIVAEPPREDQDWSPDGPVTAVIPHAIEKPVLVSEALPEPEGEKSESLMIREKPVLSSGHLVPIDVALRNLLSNVDNWHIEHDGTSAIKASWRDAASSDQAIEQIQRNAGIHIAINEETKRVGVSSSSDIAEKLTEPDSRVWHLVGGKSLRDNLAEWGDQAGWKVDFSQTMINYPVDHSAKLVGRFSGAGGVVDTVLSATAGREVPLRGRFYRANKVVVVLEAGYRSEENKMPTVGSK